MLLYKSRAFSAPCTSLYCHVFTDKFYWWPYPHLPCTIRLSLRKWSTHNAARRSLIGLLIAGDALNRPRSTCQYFNMAPSLLGQTSIFGVVFFVSKSLFGIEGQKKLENFAILTPKPRSHAWILICRTWPNCTRINKLTSVLHVYVLLLIIVKVAVDPRGDSRYLDNVMTKFILYNRTDAWKTDVHLFFTITNFQIVRFRSLPHRINYEVMCLSAYWR